MTEQQWLASEDPQAMIDYIVRWNAASRTTASERMGCRTSERKLRLIMIACCRLPWSQLNEPNIRPAIEWAELFADGKADGKSQAKASPGPTVYVDGPSKAFVFVPGTEFVAEAARAAIELYRKHSWPYLDQVPGVIRDIVGNPYRPIRLPVYGHITPEGRIKVRSNRCPWFTTQVLSLAQAAYVGCQRKCDHCQGRGWRWDGHDYNRTQEVCKKCGSEGMIGSSTLDPECLTVLSDALEEAGCTNEDILRHLRDFPGPHYRGCHVLDLILRKEQASECD